MNLLPDWRRVLRRAWSLRLMALAALLSGLEMALPFLAVDLPRQILAGLTFAVVAAAFAARLIAQRPL
jgi:hypothetical protein